MSTEPKDIQFGDKQLVFPIDIIHNDGSREIHYGLTAQEYACIELCVPESGNEWLDKLIATARRDRFAAAAMQGFIANTTTYHPDSAKESIMHADALIAELDKEGK